MNEAETSPGVEGKRIDYWYVLRVRDGSEERVRDALETHLKTDEYLPFVPTKKYPFRLKKENGRREIALQDQICFPGYVFVRSQVERFAFLREVYPALEFIKEAQFFIYYGTDKQDVAMRQHERRRIDCLMDKAFNIGISKGVVVGDTVAIIDGSLVGMEGIIVRLDRHKQTAVIRADFMGEEREIKLMLEIAQKI